MEHTKGELRVDGYTYLIDDTGRVIFTSAHKSGVHPETQTANIEEGCRRWNAFEDDGLVADLLTACERVIKLCNIQRKAYIGVLKYSNMPVDKDNEDRYQKIIEDAKAAIVAAEVKK